MASDDKYEVINKTKEKIKARVYQNLSVDDLFVDDLFVDGLSVNDLQDIIRIAFSEDCSNCIISLVTVYINLEQSKGGLITMICFGIENGGDNCICVQILCDAYIIKNPIKEETHTIITSGLEQGKGYYVYPLFALYIAQNPSKEDLKNILIHGFNNYNCKALELLFNAYINMSLSKEEVEPIILCIIKNDNIYYLTKIFNVYINYTTIKENVKYALYKHSSQCSEKLCVAYFAMRPSEDDLHFLVKFAKYANANNMTYNKDANILIITYELLLVYILPAHIGIDLTKVVQSYL